MRFIRVVWVACGGLVVLLVGAPAASAVTPALANNDHPSSDAPWLIGILVLVLLGAGATMLLFRRKVSKTSGSDFKR